MSERSCSERIQSIRSSPTLALTAKVKQLQAQGEEVLNLAAGELDFDTPDPIKEAAIRAIQEGFTKYTPTTGLPQLKEAIASFLFNDRKISYSPAQIAVTCGAKQALFNLLQVLVQPGDDVLIPSPYWVSYPEMVRLSGATPVEVKTDPKNGFRLRPEELSRHLTARSRVLILNSPANPTGAILDEEILRRIADLVAKESLWVISDEIYSQLVYGGLRHLSIAGLSREMLERTFLVDGVSKAYAMTGWRIGYLAGPSEMVEAAGRLQDHSTSNPSSISQKAALAALTGDPQVVEKMRQELCKRRDFLVQELSKIPGISFVPPEGAFYCFVDISASGISSDLFADRFLQEEKVAVIPGSGFGWDSHVRLSFAANLDVLREGVKRLDGFFRRLR